MNAAVRRVRNRFGRAALGTTFTTRRIGGCRPEPFRFLRSFADRLERGLPRALSEPAYLPNHETLSPGEAVDVAAQVHAELRLQGRARERANAAGDFQAGANRERVRRGEHDEDGLGWYGPELDHELPEGTGHLAGERDIAVRDGTGGRRGRGDTVRFASALPAGTEGAEESCQCEDAN